MKSTAKPTLRVGAANNGRLAKKRRLEIAEINEKLRAMMAKYEENSCDESMDEDGPVSVALAVGLHKCGCVWNYTKTFCYSAQRQLNSCTS